MVTIVKDILEVAKALLGMKESMQKANKQKRDEMADYFKSISVCLDETYKSLAAGAVPYGRCAELRHYGEILPEVVKNYVEDKRAWELAEMLKRSHKVEGLWEQFNIDPEKAKDLPVILESSGLFLAISNSIKAGYKP